MSGNLGCVIVAVNGNGESMSASSWAFDNLKLNPPLADSNLASHFVVLQVQSSLSIIVGLTPAAISFGDLEVPAFMAHLKRITKAILTPRFEDLQQESWV